MTDNLDRGGAGRQTITNADMEQAWMDALQGWSSIQRQYRMNIVEGLTKERDALWERVQKDIESQLKSLAGTIETTKGSMADELLQKTREFKQDVTTINQQASEIRRLLESESEHLKTSIEKWKGEQKTAIEVLNRHLQENRDLVTRWEKAADKVASMNNDDRPIPRFVITLAGAFLGCAGAIIVLLH